MRIASFLSMAGLRIPDSQKGGLIKLLSLPNESVEEMVSAFEQVTPKLFPEDLSIEVVSKIKRVSPEDVAEILDTLLSLFYSGSHHDMRPEDLAQQVVEAMVESRSPEFQLSSKEQEQFKERLVRIFKIEALLVVSKAVSVLQDNDKTFVAVRILTDVRPVFGSDIGSSPNAAVIVHMLNLSFHHGGQIQEFYMAMDTTDVPILRNALDRAELKANTLKSLIERAGVKYLDPQR